MTVHASLPAPAPDFPPLQPGCCAVCRRPEAGVGYAPEARRPPERIVWTCSADISFARSVFHMRTDMLNRLEWEALREAGIQAGQYLDEIGLTDLAALSAEQYETFLATAIHGYGESMRRQLAAHAAPF